eukprot:COSAG06_NODE_34814_length_468_cov_48.346883_1_plen_49_part_01
MHDGDDQTLSRISYVYLSHHIGKPSSSGKALFGSATPASSNAVGSQSET